MTTTLRQGLAQVTHTSIHRISIVPHNYTARRARSIRKRIKLAGTSMLKAATDKSNKALFLEMPLEMLFEVCVL